MRPRDFLAALTAAPKTPNGPMAQEIEKRTFVAEEVVEVRYTPKGTFIAHMGEIADYVVDEKLFPHWSLDSNTIKFRDVAGPPERLHGFMSHANLGFITIDPPTTNLFRDKAIQYWKAIEANPFFKIPKINRIGVRNRCFVKVQKEFPAIEKSMYGYLFKDDVMKTIGGSRKDFQAVFKFEDGERKTTVTLGPLKKNEAKQLYAFKSPHFENEGVFIDIDSSLNDPAAGSKAVDRFIRSSSEESWLRIETLLQKMGV